MDLSVIKNFGSREIFEKSYKYFYAYIFTHKRKKAISIFTKFFNLMFGTEQSKLLEAKKSKIALSVSIFSLIFCIVLLGITIGLYVRVS